ncbi:MAG: TetR/AcrR family transcriptional regulator [Planctomycetes bacterium]|nr:TetR/AcrR family transcriptional regulator [Planctomycetota bacterium]
MSTLTRKQREIREREALLLGIARRMLLERGYLGLTMDRIAAETEYSKGTIYQHFANKEDLLVALMVQSCGRRVELFDRAATFRGRPRERMTAIGVAVELFHLSTPDFAQAETLVKASSIRDKADPVRLASLEDVEARSLGICFGIARDGIAAGDLALRPGHRVEDLVLGLWSLHQGAFAIADMDLPLERLGFGDPLETLRRNAGLFMDGCGWLPLSSDYDDAALRARIRGELFADVTATRPAPPGPGPAR